MHDETTEENVRYLVGMTAAQLQNAQSKPGGLIKYLRLESGINMNNLVAFTATGQLKRYRNVQEILQEFIRFRAPFYAKRKAEMINKLQIEHTRLSNRARFIVMVVAETIQVRNIPKLKVVEQLCHYKFPLIQNRNNSEDDDGNAEVSPANKTPKELEQGYDYLLGMKLWSLTLERVAELKQEQASKAKEIEDLKTTLPSTLWERDIDAFLAALDRHEAALTPVTPAAAAPASSAAVKPATTKGPMLKRKPADKTQLEKKLDPSKKTKSV